MRHTIENFGWKTVYGRLHGDTFALYASEKSKVAEQEVKVQGASLSELEGKGGIFSKKNIYRFGVTGSGAASSSSASSSASKDPTKGSLSCAVNDEKNRGLWMAHLILAGAQRPDATLFCTVMVPLLEGEPSEVRGQGLRVLADVVKQAYEAGQAQLDEICKATQVRQRCIVQLVFKKLFRLLCPSPLLAFLSLTRSSIHVLNTGLQGTRARN